jgi:hypothetical protein
MSPPDIPDGGIEETRLQFGGKRRDVMYASILTYVAVILSLWGTVRKLSHML